jgi:hypothetical protein
MGMKGEMSVMVSANDMVAGGGWGGAAPAVGRETRVWGRVEEEGGAPVARKSAVEKIGPGGGGGGVGGRAMPGCGKPRLLIP